MILYDIMVVKILKVKEKFLKLKNLDKNLKISKTFY